MVSWSALLYLLMWYGSICMFFIYFNTFTLQQRVIVFMLISGVECLSRLINLNVRTEERTSS